MGETEERHLQTCSPLQVRFRGLKAGSFCAVETLAQPGVPPPLPQFLLYQNQRVTRATCGREVGPACRCPSGLQQPGVLGMERGPWALAAGLGSGCPHSPRRHPHVLLASCPLPGEVPRGIPAPSREGTWWGGRPGHSQCFTSRVDWAGSHGDTEALCARDQRSGRSRVHAPDPRHTPCQPPGPKPGGFEPPKSSQAGPGLLSPQQDGPQARQDSGRGPARQG